MNDKMDKAIEQIEQVTNRVQEIRELTANYKTSSICLYHATSRRHETEILKSGLLPRGTRRRLTHASECRDIYLGRGELALFYGRRADRDFQKGLLVLEIPFSALDENYIYPTDVAITFSTGIWNSVKGQCQQHGIDTSDFIRVFNVCRPIAERRMHLHQYAWPLFLRDTGEVCYRNSIASHHFSRVWRFPSVPENILPYFPGVPARSYLDRLEQLCVSM